jgi:uncharacterized DUF497 family protein
MRFDWDDAKAARNLAKHGVTFDEAATAVGDPLGWTYPDDEHSVLEKRWITIGISETDQLLVVAHTSRAGRIQIISARPATRKERRFYEEG